MTMLTYQGEKYTKPYPAWQAQTNLGVHTLSMWDGQTKIGLTYDTTGTVIGEYNGDYLFQCSEGVFSVAPRFLDRIGGVLHRLHFMLITLKNNRKEWSV